MNRNTTLRLLTGALLALTSSAWADTLSSNVSTFATGLVQPRGLKFGPDGNLYVAEAGTGGSMTSEGSCPQLGYRGGFTARVSKIKPTGVRSTVLDNLPSTTDDFDDTMGVGDIAFLGNTLYLLTSGAGCSHGHTMNDNGVLRVNSDGTTSVVANLSAYLKTHPSAQLPADFEPDGTWYNMITVGDALVALNPNQGDIEMITTTGTVTRIADTSVNPGHIVPTAMAYDGNFYVGNLGLFPIVEGSSVILKITPTGQVTTFATGLTTVLGIAIDAAHRIYVLENTTGPHGFPEPGTGKVVRVNQAGGIDEVARGLSLPTAMTFGPDGNLYVSNWGFGLPNMGEIVKITVQPVPTQFANMSARGPVESGDNILIGGIIISGSGTQRVVVRGLGPSLAQAGLPNALPNPTLDLVDSNGVSIAFNNDWQENAAQAALITAAGLAPKNSLEAAILIDLAPGAYTAIVGSNSSATGLGLVEFYNVGQ